MSLDVEEADMEAPRDVILGGGGGMCFDNLRRLRSRRASCIGGI
jgi:hypothetical protein